VSHASAAEGALQAVGLVDELTDADADPHDDPELQAAYRRGWNHAREEARAAILQKMPLGWRFTGWSPPYPDAGPDWQLLADALNRLEATEQNPSPREHPVVHILGTGAAALWDRDTRSWQVVPPDEGVLRGRDR